MKRPPRCPATQKVSYRTRRRALRAAPGTAKMLGHKVAPYRCPHCELWHLTKAVERVKRERVGERQRKRRRKAVTVTPLPTAQKQASGRKGSPEQRMKRAVKEREAAEARQRVAVPDSDAYRRALDDIARCRKEYLEAEAELKRAA